MLAAAEFGGQQITGGTLVLIALVGLALYVLRGRRR